MVDLKFSQVPQINYSDLVSGDLIPVVQVASGTSGSKVILAGGLIAAINSKQTALGFTPLNPANNLSDLASLATARSNLSLVPGTNVQTYSARLDDIVTSFPSATNGYVVRKKMDGTGLEYASLAAASVTLPGKLPEMAVNPVTPNTHIDFGAGDAVVNGALVQNSSTFTKRIDQTWATGSGNGGLFSGASLTSFGTYHCYVMRNTSSGVVDFGFDSSSSAANKPGGWDVRRIGAVVTDAGSNIRKFYQLGDRFIWEIPVFDYAGQWNTTATSTALTVPAGVEVEAILNIYAGYPPMGTDPLYLWVRYPGCANIDPVSSYDFVTRWTASSEWSVYSSEKVVRTDVNRQVRYRSNFFCANGGGLLNGSILTIGFIYPR